MNKEKLAFMVERSKPVILLAPALLVLFFSTVVPAITALYWSFFQVPLGQPLKYVGLGNFIELFSNDVFRSAIFNTFLFSALIVVGQVVVGYLAALLLSTEFPFQKFLVSVLMMPYVVSPVVAVIIWKYMLRYDAGIINYLVRALHILDGVSWATDPLHAWVVVVLIAIWLRYPFTFLISYSAIMGLPKSIFEAAHLDGASNFQVIRQIIVPLTTPALMIGSIFSFIFAFRSFDVIWLLTKGGPIRATELLSTFLYKQAFVHWDTGLAAATAFVMAVCTIIISILHLKMTSLKKRNKHA